MSNETKTESNRRGKLEMPRLEGEALEFAEKILSIGMPYRYAVQAFLDSFPSYAEHETLTESEIFEILKSRFQRMRRDTRRASYHKIKENEASLKDLLDCTPVASPLMRLIELEMMRQDRTLTCEQRLKVLGAAAREVERLMPRERTSPFSGLPDLIPTKSTTPSETETNGKPPPDPFGGAMMQNVIPRQKTPEDD
ncbi:hypothetical protein J5I95_13735 [Candidatus Poribacteria bacterium]|nr:hypothetical protein [Candidatus Poribacteria bacterium]